MGKIGGIAIFRPLMRCALVALSLLFFSACTGESARQRTEQSAWTTIDRPLFEVREVPERGVLYLDFGPVSECRGYWISPGNRREQDQSFSSNEWGFQAVSLVTVFEGNHEGLQLKTCFGVKFTTDVDALRRAVVKSRESDGPLRACRSGAWADYWKGLEEQWAVPTLKGAEDLNWGEVADSLDKTQELAELECERTVREAG